MKTIQQDLKSNNLSLNEAIDVAQNRPILETDVYVWRYALLVVHGGKEEDKYADFWAHQFSCSDVITRQTDTRMSQNTHARYKESFRRFTANEIHSNNIHSYVTVTVKIADVQTGKSRWWDFLRHVCRCSVAWAQISVVEMFRCQTEEVAVTTEREVLNTVWTQLQRTFQRLKWWRQPSEDWLIEHGFTSAPTQYRLYGRRFLQVKRTNQQCQSNEGGWLVIQTGLSLTRLTSPCYNNTTCMQI